MMGHIIIKGVEASVKEAIINQISDAGIPVRIVTQANRIITLDDLAISFPDYNAGVTMLTGNTMLISIYADTTINIRLNSNMYEEILIR